MRRKEIVFLGIIFVISIAGAILFFSKQSLQPTQQTSVPKPTEIAKPPPEEARVPDAPANVLFSYVGPAVSIPKTLPEYKTTDAQPSLADIQDFSVKLGFSGAGQKETNSKLTLISWTNPTGSLSYSQTQNSGSLYYQKTLSKNQPQTANTQPADIVKNFLKQNLPTQYDMKISEVNNAEYNNVIILDNPSPSLKTESVEFLVNKAYPVLTSDYTSVSSTFIVDSNGVVRYFTYSFPPTTSTPTVIEPISFNDAISSLNTGRGLLLSSVDKTGWGTNPIFQSVQLTSMNIVYVSNSSTKTLEPAYVFDGVGYGKDKTQIAVQYYLSALTK